MAIRNDLTVKIKRGASCQCHPLPDEVGVVVGYNDDTVRVAWVNENGTGKEIHRFSIEDVEQAG